ncbi:MAG: ribose 5-phosphate isomerase B [Clostridia bacterium]|nr:ribose 5-phosphate isomerase B [Clostridia bacterium]
MKICLCSDHGGLGLKKAVMKYLDDSGYEYKDFGCFSQDSCDYPDFAYPAAKALAKGEYDRGIFICSTGIGMSIVANKVKGVRCAHCHDVYCAEFTRRHNDANALAIGEKVVGEGYALEIVKVFLETEFEGGRHERRVGKISKIEDEEFK